MSLFETKCPLCKGMLWIDTATMEIVDHKPTEQQQAHKSAFAQFMKDSKKPKGWDDKMKRAQEEEARRKAEIEERFRQAKDGGSAGVKDMLTGGPKSLLDWD